MALTSQRPVLMVDDDDLLLKTYEGLLRSSGFEAIECCGDGLEALERLRELSVGAVILDLTLPGMDGEDVLRTIKSEMPDIPVIISSAANEVDTAVSCMSAGAFDYLVKPVDATRLTSAVRRAMEMRELRRENTRLKKHLMTDALERPDSFKDVVTRNRAMVSIFQYIEAIADTMHPVLLVGEAGTGRELLAEAVHVASKRKGEFITASLEGIADDLIIEGLFGTKGASEGNRPGCLVEQAAGGTLLLHGIGGIGSDMQYQLVRLARNQSFLPAGSGIEKRASCRLVLTTDSDLKDRVDKGDFRDDLYYQLWAHHIEVPALRERAEDIPVLLDHFLTEAARAFRKKKPTPPRELVTLLANYEFPGNISELRSLVYEAVKNHRSGVLAMDTFRNVLKGQAHRRDVAEEDSDIASLIEQVHPLPSFKQIEDVLMLEALKRTDGNQSIAAGLLGVTRQTLNRRLKEIRKPEESEEAE